MKLTQKQITIARGLTKRIHVRKYFMNKFFVNVTLITKFTKILYHENLELYRIHYTEYMFHMVHIVHST